MEQMKIGRFAYYVGNPVRRDGFLPPQPEVHNTVKVQFYHWDGGLFRKSYIQKISREEFVAIQRADKGPKVIEITHDDWDGRKLPAVLRADQCG